MDSVQDRIKNKYRVKIGASLKAFCYEGEEKIIDVTAGIESQKGGKVGEITSQMYTEWQ